MLNESQCGTCLYFRMDEESYPEKRSDFEVGVVNGTCRRQCPVAQKPDEDGKYTYYGYWPEILSGEWCGGYRENLKDGGMRNPDMWKYGKPAQKDNGKTRPARCGQVNCLSR